ncbi:MAG: GTP cyclohydrolase I FolE [Gammaproteobacteria bacterium]|nr:GTP cyclohydrolase I FolE [Gammaproteobacteria bacterium]NND54029.1 GTP cyclohydrolase I FolE [Gammaproteobacteria bacterium]
MSPISGVAATANYDFTHSLEEENHGLRPEAVLVKAALAERGLETPTVPVALNAEQKRAVIEKNFTEILQVLGLDLTDDSLCDTPRRVAKMYVNEIFSGLDYSNFPRITVIENKMQVDEMVRVSDIDLASTCEHHLVTIDGCATVAYIPSDKVVGLSKINRIVRFFAQRPQVQERLNEQIMVALQTLLETDDVAVSITATHFCVKARGVMDSNSQTSTTSLGGAFKINPETRREFLLGLKS